MFVCPDVGVEAFIVVVEGEEEEVELCLPMTDDRNGTGSTVFASVPISLTTIVASSWPPAAADASFFTKDPPPSPSSSPSSSVEEEQLDTTSV